MIEWLLVMYISILTRGIRNSYCFEWALTVTDHARMCSDRSADILRHTVVALRMARVSSEKEI